MRDSIGQKMPDGGTPGQLRVVATPIGNLGDISLRAKEALATASAVLCEDTRQGAKLLSALGISGPRLERLDAHSGERALKSYVSRLEAGEVLALITDAGTPAISDPGSALVALAHEAGVTVTPIPGPSAVIALLSAAGFEETVFTFRGFFPRKPSEIKEELDLAAKSETARVSIWFESPQRIADSLKTAAQQFPDLLMIAAKELTKVHERFFRGSLVEVSQQVTREIEREGARGEWCFAIKFPKFNALAQSELIPEDSLKALRCLLDAGIPASEAAKRVSQEFAVKKNEVYEAALKISGKKNPKK